MSQKPSAFDELQEHAGFIRRHIGPDERDRQAMLAELGFDSMDSLIRKAIPAAILSRDELNLDEARTEAEVLESLHATRSSSPTSAPAITIAIRPPSSCATCWRTRPGTPPIRPISPRFRRGGWKRC